MLDLENYILPQEELNWQELLESWAWILPQAPLEIWLVSRFADLFISREDDGSVWMLDTNFGTFERLAGSQDEFIQQLDREGIFENWFRVADVDAMTALGQVPRPGQCYSYKRLPRLGGDFTTDNMTVANIAVHMGMHGQIFERIKDLPEGTVINNLTISKMPG